MYKSNASWTKIPDSQDEHDSFEMANAICMRLREDYGSRSCSIRGYCIKAWVTDKDGKVVSKEDYADLDIHDKVRILKSECSEVGLDNLAAILYQEFAYKLDKGIVLRPHDIKYIEDMWEIRGKK